LKLNKESAPTKPAKTKRSVKDFFTSKKKKLNSTASRAPAAEDSPTLKRKRVPLRDRAQGSQTLFSLLII
jgi:beta-xylosidase